MPARPDNPPLRRARKVTALLAGLVVFVSACSGGTRLASSSPESAAVTTTIAPSSPPAPSTTTTSTSTTTTTTTTTVPPGPPPDIRLQAGDRGPAVFEIEQRLLAAGYWLGSVDDVYDASTAHAVTALQKAVGLDRTGVTDLATLAALLEPVALVPRSTAGPVIEVDIARQVMLVVRDGVVAAVFDVSTGRKVGWTPTGEHAVTREIDGIRHAPLGRLYRPKYFIRGVAVHGYPQVPSEPASHGCVRVTNEVMDHIWAADLMPKGTPVWVY